MKFNYFRSIRFFSLILILFLAGAVPASEVINWRSYEEGMVVSKIEQKKCIPSFLCRLVRLLPKNGARHLSGFRGGRLFE